jgi:hypothetical protein
MQGNDNSSSKTASDIQNSIYSGSRGDMLNLKLKIIGDPQLIKQDDVYNNPGCADYKSITNAQIIASNGSLVMDNGELYAKVMFKTPVDIDENTGLMRKDGKYVESVFSGMYKFLTVDNEFRGGKFEQTCDLVRMPDDVAGAVTNKPAVDINRQVQPKSMAQTRDDQVEVDSWSDEGGMMVLDEDKWNESEDGALTLKEDEEEPFLLNSDDAEEEIELEELSGNEDEEEQLAEIVAETEEIDVVDWENEQNNEPESQPADTPAQAEAIEVQSQPSNTPRGKAIAEQQRVLDALQNDITVYTSASQELQTEVDKMNDELDTATEAGNPAAIKTAQRNLQRAIDEKKNMTAKLKEAQAQVGEEEQKLKAI